MRVAALMLLGCLMVAAACGGSTSNEASTGGSGGSSSGGASAGGSTQTGGTGNVSSLTACSAPGTCALFATNCCGGYCDGAAPLSGFQAVNEAKVNELEAQLCTGDIACPGCVSVENLSYLALCRAGQCTAVNLREDALSACQSDADCRVRWGNDCCEDCGGNAELIAYAKNQNIEAELCNPNDGACPPCAPPPYPPFILPLCGPDKHCTWTLLGP